MFKKRSLILPAVISTSFLVSCTHVFESKNTEIDLSVFKNVKNNLENISSNINTTTVATNNNEAIMKMAVELVAKDINNQNRSAKPKTKIITKVVEEKKQSVIKPVEVIAQAIPSREISLIEHNGFDGKIQNQIDFNKLNWALPVEANKNEKEISDEIITDTIQTASAANEKIVDAKPEVDDEIKVFEYDTNQEEAALAETYQLPSDLKFEATNAPIQTELKLPRYAEAKLSSSVLNVIKRETNFAIKDKNKDRFVIPNSNQAEPMSYEEDAPSVYEIADSISKESSSTLKKPVNKKDIIKNAFTEMPIDGASKISYKILGRLVDPGNKTEEAFGFEFIPHYDRNDRVSDSSGEINLEYSVMGSQNVVSGMILKQGHVDIQTDLDLNSSSMKSVIPLIETEKFEKFLQTNKLNTNGSYILVNTTKGYSDIELDGQNLPKVLLTSKFKVVQKDETPTFILLAGVLPGNNFVKLKNENGWTQKVLNNQENMITYIDEESRESEDQSLELYTETKSGKLVELSASGTEIKLLSSKNNVRKISTNKIAFKTPTTLSTQKNYLEIKKESSTFVGINGNENELNIPTQREKELIMTEFGVSDLQNSCIIQINSSDDIARLRLGGPSDIGEIYTQVIYADREGNLSTELSEWTNKAYVLGDRTGVLNIQVEYSNGATKMTNSYCSNDVYLVENL